MGQKVNPHGLRVGVIKDWDSRWYASDEKVGDLLVEDHKIRAYLKKTLYSAGVPKIEIERSSDVVTIYLHCARPGVVIGKGGEQIEQYRLAVEKMVGKKVRLNIVEVKNPDMDAQLVAENIAQQLEKRISFRRAMKNSMILKQQAPAKFSSRKYNRCKICGRPHVDGRAGYRVRHRQRYLNYPVCGHFVPRTSGGVFRRYLRTEGFYQLGVGFAAGCCDSAADRIYRVYQRS